MSKTITLSPEALLDMLTQAACLGRDMQSASTRGDVTAALAPYGYRLDNLDAMVERVETGLARAQA